MASPWVTRAQRAELHASDRTGHVTIPERSARTVDVTETLTWSPLRVATDGGSFRTVADLQRLIARENER